MLSSGLEKASLDEDLGGGWVTYGIGAQFRLGHRAVAADAGLVGRMGRRKRRAVAGGAGSFAAEGLHVLLAHVHS